ncbi:unnamed protein product, partial [Soboliphyme baturini]|uniref:RNA polymerase-associated protein LEO1 n=1 Tax=Soboliphyme baturini TaxID=241478 RepID=A0A183IRH5_9BILA
NLYLEELFETLIDAEVPKINIDLGNQIHFVKFPNFLSVEPRMFDPDAYEDEIDEDQVLDEEGRSRLKLKVENTIRWRNAVDEHGNTVRESNARIVRMSLYLGSEVFDVHLHPLQGDHHHLFIRQGTGLQGRALFRTKLTFRPHSIESFTHRKMTLSMADRNNKTQKVKVLSVVGTDPETQKQKEEERLRASRRLKERSHMRGLSANYLEADRDESEEDEGAVSISAIKRRFKTGAKQYIQSQHAGDHSGAESDESDESTRQKLEHTKRLDSDDEDEEETDDKPKRRAKVIEESDEEDDD